MVNDWQPVVLLDFPHGGGLVNYKGKIVRGRPFECRTSDSVPAAYEKCDRTKWIEIHRDDLRHPQHPDAIVALCEHEYATD
jgi:hypothetical protein